MSATPQSPLHTLFNGLSAEELIAEEQEHQVSETLTPASSILGKRTSEFPESDNDDEGPRSPSPEGEDLSGPSSGTQGNSGSLLTEQSIRRLGKRLRLSNEDITLVEQFAQVCVPCSSFEAHI